MLFPMLFCNGAVHRINLVLMGCCNSKSLVPIGLGGYSWVKGCSLVFNPLVVIDRCA